MKEAQTLQEALNAALNDVQAWKAAALASQAERDALVAMCDRLVAMVNKARDLYIEEHADGETDCVTPFDWYDATPERCLAEVRAEAGRLGFIAGANWQASDDLPLTRDLAAKLYAEQIRKGGAK